MMNPAPLPSDASEYAARDEAPEEERGARLSSLPQSDGRHHCSHADDDHDEEDLKRCGRG
jgi:hypothetical protein